MSYVEINTHITNYITRTPMNRYVFLRLPVIPRPGSLVASAFLWPLAVPHWRRCWPPGRQSICIVTPLPAVWNETEIVTPILPLSFVRQ
jgi:hypothetical protein